MTPQQTLVFVGSRASRAGGVSLASAYQALVLAYIVSLLYLYPYGITLGSIGSVRAPDLLGLLCLAVGAAAIVMGVRLRADRVFLVIVGPFLFLELVTPTIGGIGYGSLSDVGSSLRMAILWLPMVLVTMLTGPFAEPRFEAALRRILAVSLWTNAFYAVIQVAAAFGFAPRWLLFTELLASWAVEDYFNVVQGLRPAGFFVNTTALAVFGISCLSYFYAHYAARRQAGDLRYALLSLFVILVTTSRAAFVAAGLIVMCGWFLMSRARKVVVLSILAAAGAAFLVAVDQTIGLEQAFYRFTRLAESGLLADVSFGKRVHDTWPTALAVARDYPLGTLISAPRVAELIDSGYLNYYMQGRWVFIAAVAIMLAGQVFVAVRFVGRENVRAGALMMLFAAIYLALGMITANPARSPLVIIFLVFAFWKVKADRSGRWIAATPGNGKDA